MQIEITEKELAEIEDIDAARTACKSYPYSDLNGGMDRWEGEY